MVDQMENFLADLGFRNIRARHIKHTVRIEVEPGQIARFFDPAIRENIVKKVKKSDIHTLPLIWKDIAEAT